ncbi:MAG TPA: UDP-3-O-(3-hydroxymyristoyl)glucosamine N-acyltransferase [Stellaceae bacterium]
MADQRFFHRSGPFPLSYIARHIEAEPPDDASGAMMIDDIGPLETAGLGEITVFCDARYLDKFLSTRASATVTNHDLARLGPNRSGLLLVEHPRLAYAQIGHLFYPASPPVSGVDASASIDPTAVIGDESQIDAGAVISTGAKIGARCHIGVHAFVGPGVVIGDDCAIGANTAISHALLGDRVRIESCVTVGSQGFGFVPGPKGMLRMLQLGRVVIEDDVEIGANCAIDRGATGDTVIGAGTVIDNLVQIGHNVRIGQKCVLCGQVGVAGSTEIGAGVMIGGQSAISDHLTIGSGARIAGKSGVMRNVKPGEAVGGYPAVPIRQWHRQTSALSRLLQRKSNSG